MLIMKFLISSVGDMMSGDGGAEAKRLKRIYIHTAGVRSAMLYGSKIGP